MDNERLYTVFMNLIGEFSNEELLKLALKEARNLWVQ